MKDFLSKIFVLRLNWMFGFLYLILLIELTSSVISKLSGKSCFLYPINEYEPSPWFSIQRNHDTTVILENMPMRTPVNITLKKYQSEDTFCLLSVRLHKIDIYGSCLHGEQNKFSLDNNIDDKTLVLHVHESIFQVSVEDVMIKLNPLPSELSELTHENPEWMDKEDLAKENAVPMNVFDSNQYVMQISSDIAEENRLHAAVGCEYGEECIMEFEKTILVIKSEITLMALSNSTELEGEVFVHYGNSDFKRTKPLVMKMPLRSLEEGDTWEEVADVSPQFLDREGSEGYIYYLNKDLIYSPRSPGLVGTVREKELILDFTHTKNVKWGVPCPEKPESLDLNFSVITTTPAQENDAEIFIPDDSNEEMKLDMLTSMVRGELDQIKAIIESSSQPELEGLELEKGFDPIYEEQVEPIPEPSPEPGDDPESASVKSNLMRNTPEAIILMSMHLIVILTRSVFL